MKCSIIAAVAGLLLSASSITAVPVETQPVEKIVPGNQFDRVVVIVLANANYDDAIKDPYFSKLAEKHNGITLTNHKALTHPSQGNYVSK
jgi:hypothetical protein